MADPRVISIATGLRLFQAGVIDANSLARAIVGAIDLTVECGTVVASRTRPTPAHPTNHAPAPASGAGIPEQKEP